MRCDQCQFWDGERPGYYGEVRKVGQCLKAKMFWDTTEWNDECERVPLPEYADLKMFVQDGSDYHAMLLTTPDFFCAHFSKKV